MITVNKTSNCKKELIDSNDVSAKKQLNSVWKKLQNLQKSLHINKDIKKKSDCFWCTFSFDNSPIYIPKNKVNDSYNVYGCFCSPECAVSFLMNENIDQSVKFERYSLINYIYGKIYDYSKNIKPAPDPYYLLDKYYGNLTIQEYRKLLSKDRLIMVVDKPLTRIMPEIHEDNNEYNIDINTNSNSNSTSSNNTYRLSRKKKKVEKSYFLE